MLLYITYMFCDTAPKCGRETGKTVKNRPAGTALIGPQDGQDRQDSNCVNPVARDLLTKKMSIAYKIKSSIFTH